MSFDEAKKYPYNLIYDVFGEEKEEYYSLMPYLLGRLSERDRNFIHAIYRHGISAQKSAEIYLCYHGNGNFHKDLILESIKERYIRNKELKTQIEKMNLPTLPAELDVHISTLGLTTRAYNCLAKNYCDYTSDMIVLINTKEIFSIRNLGQKTYKEIIDKLKQKGLAEYLLDCGE